MNYTEKYRLPQWEETDRILRADFNKAMSRIENGIKGTDTASTQRDDELSARVTAAQSELETKITAARAAAETAQETADRPICAAGAIWNLGHESTIEVGFRPSAVLITYFHQETDEKTGEVTVKKAATAFTGDGVTGVLSITDTGFKTITRNIFPEESLYESLRYIAFR